MEAIDLFRSIDRARDGEFRWIDIHNQRHRVENMETRHLFFTLRMIWNHAVPVSHRIEPYRMYRFGPQYTHDYIVGAIREIGSELSTRNDLEPYWEECLLRMARSVAALHDTSVILA